MPETATEMRIKETPVLLVAILSLITAGIYVPVWYLMRRKAINSLQSVEKIGKAAFILCLFGFVICFFLSLAAGVLIVMAQQANGPDYLVVAQILSLASGVLSLIVGIVLIIQALKVRDIIEGHLHYATGERHALSVVWTSFFNNLYLQYKINRIQDDARRISQARLRARETGQNSQLTETGSPSG